MLQILAIEISTFCDCLYQSWCLSADIGQLSQNVLCCSGKVILAAFWLRYQKQKWTLKSWLSAIDNELLRSRKVWVFKCEYKSLKQENINRSLFSAAVVLNHNGYIKSVTRTFDKFLKFLPLENVTSFVFKWVPEQGIILNAQYAFFIKY